MLYIHTREFPKINGFSVLEVSGGRVEMQKKSTGSKFGGLKAILRNLNFSHPEDRREAWKALTRRA